MPLIILGSLLILVGLWGIWAGYNLRHQDRSLSIKTVFYSAVYFLTGLVMILLGVELP